MRNATLQPINYEENKMLCIEMEVIAIALKAAATGKLELYTLNRFTDRIKYEASHNIAYRESVLPTLDKRDNTLYLTIEGWFCAECYWKAGTPTLTFEEFFAELKRFYGVETVVVYTDMPVLESEFGAYRCVSGTVPAGVVPEPGYVPKLDGVEWRLRTKDRLSQSWL